MTCATLIMRGRRLDESASVLVIRVTQVRRASLDATVAFEHGDRRRWQHPVDGEPCYFRVRQPRGG